MIEIKGRAALVTGGSVGTRLAHAFLEKGCRVALVFRDSKREAILKKEFPPSPDTFLAIQADLAHGEESLKAVEYVKSAFGAVHFLLNSLGGWLGGKKLHDHTEADLGRMLSMDFVPTFNIMRAVLPVMVEQRFGRIVNFVSLQALHGGKGNSVYSASKSAVQALSTAAAEEYKEDGISVNTIAPSVINTELNRAGMPTADTSKWVSINDVVDAALYLCGSESSVNGTIIKLPGKL